MSQAQLTTQIRLGARPRPTRAVRLLVAEPELGEGLTAAEFEQAQRQLVLPAVALPVGPLDLDELGSGPDVLGRLYGFLVLDGTLMVSVRVSGRRAGRLVSSGELALIDVRANGSMPVELEWSVIASCRLACIDHRLLEVVRRWPPLLGAITRRAAEHAHQALVQQAISQLPKVEDRLLALFWSLADRQGVVRADGIWLELTVTHETLAVLVGAQRPTVSLGLTRLAEDGQLRAEPGGWLLNPASLSAVSGI